MIRFGSGDVTVHPSATQVGGPEIAPLQVHADFFREGALMVWQPGDGILAGRDRR